MNETHVAHEFFATLWVEQKLIARAIKYHGKEKEGQEEGKEVKAPIVWPRSSAFLAGPRFFLKTTLLAKGCFHRILLPARTTASTLLNSLTPQKADEELP